MLSKNEVQTQPSRIDYIDIFRGIGILFMVMGHVGFGEAFDFFIHAFHMPMFFWISGYLFRRRSKEEMSFSAFVLKKAKSLLLPYGIFGVVHYLIYVVKNVLTHEAVELSPLIRLFFVNTSGLPICGALWFLTALFFADILFFLIDRYVVNNLGKAAVVVALAVFGNFADCVIPFTLPLALGPSFVGVGLYYLGFLFQKYGEKPVVSRLMNLRLIPTVALGVITTASIFGNGYVNMRMEQYAVVPLFWVNGLLSIIVGMNLSKQFYRYVQNRFVGNWLLRVGKDSMIYVCLNQVVIMVVSKAVKIVALPKYLSAVVILIITMGSLYALSELFTTTKLKWILGKK